MNIEPLKHASIHIITPQVRIEDDSVNATSRGLLVGRFLQSRRRRRLPAPPSFYGPRPRALALPEWPRGARDEQSGGSGRERRKEEGESGEIDLAADPEEVTEECWAQDLEGG